MNANIRVAALVATALGLTATVAFPACALENYPIVLAQSSGNQEAVDQATTMRVKAALLSDSELKTQSIVVETVNGTVRLTGQVNNTSNVDRAKEVVARVDGVRNVENLLVLKLVTPA